MMGSNNHIITNSASALSNVRGTKESCRVHTRAASLPRCRALSHVCMCSFTHTHQHLSAWWDTIREHIHKHTLGDTRGRLFGCQDKEQRFRSGSAKSGQRWDDSLGRSWECWIAHSLSNDCIEWQQTSARPCVNLQGEAAGTLEHCSGFKVRCKHTRTIINI